MSPKDAARALDEVARDLDLLMYRIERPTPADVDAAKAERRRLHRELEGLRERVESVSKALG